MLRTYSPNVLKYFGNFPCLIQDQSKQFAVAEEVMISEREVQYIDVTTGNKVSILAEGTAGELEEVKDEIVINSQPEEAIMVLFDISGSMGNHISQNLQRIQAAKEFFYAFADRIMAYRFKLVIALMIFHSTYSLKCNFTEVFRSFKNHVERCAPTGGTRLYDTVIAACEELDSLAEKYPGVVKRILCFSDGEDLHSKKTAFDAAAALRNHNIILDFVNIGEASNDVKAISILSGGYPYFFTELKQGIKMFEAETFLRVKMRYIYIYI